MKNKINYLLALPLFLFSFISNGEIPIFGPGSAQDLLSQYKELMDNAAIGAASGQKVDFDQVKNLLNKIESSFKDKVGAAYFRQFISQSSFYPADKINLEGPEALKQFVSTVGEKRSSIDDLAKEEFDTNKFSDLAVKFGQGLITKEVFERGKARFLDQIAKDKQAVSKDVKVAVEAAPISRALQEKVTELGAQADDYDQLKKNALKHIQGRLDIFLKRARTISVAKDQVTEFKEFVEAILKSLNQSGVNSFTFNKLGILEDINDKLGQVQKIGFTGSPYADVTVLSGIKNDIAKYAGILKYEERKKLAEDRKQKAEAGAAQKKDDKAEVAGLIKQINDILPSVPQNADKNILLKAFYAANQEEVDLDAKLQKLEALLKLAKEIKADNFLAIGASKLRLKQLGL